MNIVELARLRPVLGDGAMGTMLQEHGFKSGDCPEVWNLERPEVIIDIHKAYGEAGCDFVETNTFGANTIKLSRYNLANKLEEIVARAVDLARQAAGDSCLIAGSVGPTGVLLQPYGDYTRDEVGDAFRGTARAMEDAGVDFFLVETMSDVNEALLAVEAVKEASERPILATMAFSEGARGYRTMMGVSPQEAATSLTAAGVALVGTNCCAGVDEAVGILTDMVEATPLAVIAQPNAGLPALVSGKAVYPESPRAMAEGVSRLLTCGARIIGGCCGTTPAHIREMGSGLGKC